MTVFANSLEVSSKAQGCKVIAAFPDTCFTPPQTPATPPGVPIPYPDFGTDSDVTSGSGTVKIGGKEISQENSSKYAKCTGDEAGAAPKKGVITSKNTGPIYAQKWSMDVKVEGKGVVRFGDMATSNHACNPGDSPPTVVVGKFYINIAGCEAVFAEFKLHRHGDSGQCPDGHESEHFVQNEYLQWERGKKTAPRFENYTTRNAPCICMESYNKTASGKYKKNGKDPKRGSPHNKKTVQCNNEIKTRTTTPTLSEAVDFCVKAVVENDPRTKNNKKKKEKVGECLKLAFIEYMDRAMKEKDPNASSDDAMDQPIAWEVDERTTRMWARE